MGRTITPEERILTYFTECTADQATTMLEKISLVLRGRKIGAPPKRGRPPKKREKPPLEVAS